MLQEKTKRRSSNVVLLGLVSFINDTASKTILPILPLFIKEIGGGGAAVGLISGLSDSISSILKMVSGVWSDKLKKRKPFVFWGYLISSASKLLLYFSYLWEHVLLLRVFERAGKGLRASPRDAILAESTEKEQRGKGFGVHRALDSGGALLGALLAFFLFWFLKFDFRKIFLLAGIVSFFSLIPLLFVKEQKRENALKEKGTLPFNFKNIPPALRKFVVVASIYALGNFSYMFFVLKSQEAFKGRYVLAAPILLYALYYLSYTVFSVPSGMLSDKIGRKRVLFLGYMLFAMVCVGFAVFSSLFWFLVLFFLFGVNYALTNSTERAFAADLSKADFQGTGLGAYHTSVSFAMLPGGVVAGVLWDINPNFTFAYGALISLMAALLLFFGFKNIN
jgi:MFS family permease